MKARSKALLLTLCAVLLVTVSVLGTMAYLTSQDTVTNTFTVGQVAITLDETDTDHNTPDANRDKANAYHLLPGKEYVKDPIIHVDSVSEDSWIFVKVENGIADYEAATSTAEGGYKNIATQITDNGWTALNGVADVYYKSYTKNAAGADLAVFSNFKIADNANDRHGWKGINPDTTKIEVTAYAVQSEGFTTASAAWTNTFGRTPVAP